MCFPPPRVNQCVQAAPKLIKNWCWLTSDLCDALCGIKGSLCEFNAATGCNVYSHSAQMSQHAYSPTDID